MNKKFMAEVWFDASKSTNEEPDCIIMTKDLRTMLHKVKRMLRNGNGDSKARVTGPNNSFCFCRLKEDWWGNGLKYVFTYRWYDAIDHERYIEHGISAGNL